MEDSSKPFERSPKQWTHSRVFSYDERVQLAIKRREELMRIPADRLTHDEEDELGALREFISPSDVDSDRQDEE